MRFAIYCANPALNAYPTFQRDWLCLKNWETSVYQKLDTVKPTSLLFRRFNSLPYKRRVRLPKIIIIPYPLARKFFHGTLVFLHNVIQLMALFGLIWDLYQVPANRFYSELIEMEKAQEQ